MIDDPSTVDADFAVFDSLEEIVGLKLKNVNLGMLPHNPCRFSVCQQVSGNRDNAALPKLSENCRANKLHHLLHQRDLSRQPTGDRRFET